METKNYVSNIFYLTYNEPSIYTPVTTAFKRKLHLLLFSGFVYDYFPTERFILIVPRSVNS